MGGTFTDLAYWDAERNEVHVHKLLTTPEDPTDAIIDGLAQLPRGAELVVHGTTLVTNALIERRGVKAGLVTTDGYRDVLEVGTELRYDTFDLFLERAEPLIPRHLRLAVVERTGVAGDEVVALDEQAVRDAGRVLVEQGVDAIAVAFFNAYRNPDHERRAIDILAEACPGVMVCASSDVAPEIREYERFSTVAANAYVQPLATRYLRRLAERVGVPLMIILSDGGITTAQLAGERPIALVESGPAAGAMSAAHLAAAGGWKETVAFDMGGTTAKISLIHDGAPEITHTLEVARVHRFKKGSGLPVRVPTVNLIEIGAGGGSIATASDLGLLKVGPRSAGAVPGPVCYGRGGTEPTVTDADLVLGYLAPDSFLGGKMRLDLEGAEAALDRLAEKLGVDRVAAAAGITEVVNNNMATAARLHISEQGRDPRRYRMIAFGGAGPVHAYGIARLLHVDEVVFQRGAGVASAIGMLVAPRSVECVASQVVALDAPDWDAIDPVVAELAQRGRTLLAEAGVDAADVLLDLSADMRYLGQGAEVTVPLSLAAIDARDGAALSAAFADEYRARFDRTLPGMPVEVISWRLRARSPAVVDTVDIARDTDPTAARAATTRPAYFAEAGGYVETAVVKRAGLVPGERLAGPVLIEEDESTIVVGPSGSVAVDDAGNLLMTITSDPRRHEDA
ncbi:Acetophenone carboxylase gamma subunit [Baekduia alba]|uniref:hydantoinase/oxoprolinase family protein n=1 Tax=Baekduia alba TaxID=2997333 RepID=UPI0023400AA5|nr:hydantoinase/oxoprolinase family protein [Baekduia alba]WCB96338.1 Acetophenone carboxylase gamma subunit [Baekduia alba]